MIKAQTVGAHGKVRTPLAVLLATTASVSSLDTSRLRDGLVPPAALGLEDCCLHTCSFPKPVPS